MTTREQIEKRLKEIERRYEPLTDNEDVFICACGKEFNRHHRGCVPYHPEWLADHKQHHVCDYVRTGKQLLSGWRAMLDYTQVLRRTGGRAMIEIADEIERRLWEVMKP